MILVMLHSVIGTFKKKFLIGLRKLILKCGVSKRIQSAIEQVQKSAIFCPCNA